MSSLQELGVPKLKDGLGMEDDVSVTLPAWIWAVACVLLQNMDESEGSSYVGLLLVRAQEAIMHPAYLKEREAARAEAREKQKQAMQAIQTTVFGMGGGDDAIE